MRNVARVASPMPGTSPGAASAALAVLSLLLASSTARADEAPLSLRLEVDHSEVPQGETVRLDVVLTVRSQQQVEELALPEVPRAFTIMQERRASSTQVGSVNGKRSITVEQRYMFVLRAEEAGTFRIGEASARLGRAVARAAPVTIKVTPSELGDDGGAVPAPEGPLPGARFGNDVPAAFLEVTVDKDTAWLGEQVTVTTEVYTQQPLSQWPRMPPLKPAGFFCVPLLGDDRPAPSQRTIAGRLYYVYLVNKDALFATSAGTKTIPVQSVDLVPAGSFFARSRDVQVKSPKLSVTVRPLPDDGKPESFAGGNVGHWQLSTSVRPQVATLGQPFTLTVAATGAGNIDQLQLPTWDGGNVARVFPPTSRIERRPTSATEPELAGRVVAEMLVQPLREGDIKIPPLTLHTFDPEKGEYRSSSTGTIVVPVKAAKGAGAGGATAAANGGRQVIAKGARPLHTGATLEAPPSEMPVLVGGACAGTGALAYAIASARRRRRSSADGLREAQRKARDIALADAATRGDLAALERIVLDALADAYGPAVKSCATSALATELGARGADAALVDDVVRFIKDVEAARYMKGGAPGERERMANAASALVERVSGGAS